jgi:radical SAM protein with 4Fe4S-binding SPASM domain
MIRFSDSKTNGFLIRILAVIFPFLAKSAIGFYLKIRFFCLWKKTAKKAKNQIEEFFEAESMPLFDYVEIETINRCNSTCSFCPVNRNSDSRSLAKMSENTFRKIIDNLAKLNFCGAISYFSNNEPLMDNRIIEFVKYGVSKIPNARHQLLSNGTLLTEDEFQKLIDSGLNYMGIDSYNDKLKLGSNIQKIYDKYKKENFSMDCEITRRFINQTLSNRGGGAPNKLKARKILKAPCYFPFRQLIIRADCGVSLCCNDALGKITLGNVEEQTLEEIWFGEKHLNILKSIRKNFRNDIEICKKCDVIATREYFFLYPGG